MHFKINIYKVLVETNTDIRLSTDWWLQVTGWTLRVMDIFVMDITIYLCLSWCKLFMLNTCVEINYLSTVGCAWSTLENLDIFFILLFYLTQSLSYYRTHLLAYYLYKTIAYSLDNMWNNKTKRRLEKSKCQYRNHFQNAPRRRRREEIHTFYGYFTIHFYFFLTELTFKLHKKL